MNNLIYTLNRLPSICIFNIIPNPIYAKVSKMPTSLQGFPSEICIFPMYVTRRCNVQTFISHMFPASVHRMVVNTFKFITNYKPLLSGQCLEFKW